MTFRRHCKTFDSVRSCMNNLEIAIANNSVRATAMSKTHNKLTLFVVNLHFVREWIDFLMAKCENLEFFSRDTCSKVPNPLPDEFRAYCGSVLGRYSASLGQVSTLGRPGPSPFNPGEGQGWIHFPFIARPHNSLCFTAGLCSPNLIWGSMTFLKWVELAHELL